jgi:4-carboxymuconolactone decarboxylase
MPDHGHHGGMRLPDLAPADLDDVQRALYDDIVGGPRGSGPQHFALTTPDGALTGPFGVMVHEPALGRPLQELGSAIRYRTGLSGRVREIAILAVAVVTDSAFERHAHERVARATGLTDDELAALSDGTFLPADPVEESAYALCRRLLDDRSRLTDEEYADLVGVLGTTTITELVTLVGYYRTLAQLLDVFDVGAPAQ